MRNLARPPFKAEEIFEDCVRGIGNAAKVDEFRRAKYIIDNAESDYLTAANDHILYELAALEADNDTLLFETLSKKDILGLYSSQMVPAKKAARHYYDKLLVSCPQRRCPFCGFGRATTLDHFLNKADFPWLAIVPINLVPACKDCNQRKGTGRAVTSDEQVLHPYFERNFLSDNQWLFASVIPDEPLSIDYSVSPPLDWDRATRLRVERHFEEFELRSRFAVEASTELSSLRFTLGILENAGRNAIKQHLRTIALGEYMSSKNSWRTALYQALSESDWYIDSGYQME